MSGARDECLNGIRDQAFAASHVTDVARRAEGEASASVAARRQATVIGRFHSILFPSADDSVPHEARDSPD